jgi:hypothetical protein
MAMDDPAGEPMMEGDGASFRPSASIIFVNAIRGDALHMQLVVVDFEHHDPERYCKWAVHEHGQGIGVVFVPAVERVA